jgi:hypothetical protein
MMTKYIGHVACKWEKERLQNWCVKREGKRPLGRDRHGIEYRLVEKHSCQQKNSLEGFGLD